MESLFRGLGVYDYVAGNVPKPKVWSEADLTLRIKALGKVEDTATLTA